MPNTDIPSHSYAVLDKLNIFLDKQKQYYSLYAFFLAMPLISKCQLPFKLRPRCGKLRHTNKKNLKIPPVKGLQAHLFILIRFHSVSLAGLGLFLGLSSLFQDALYLLRHSPSSNPNTLFPASFSLHQHSSCLCEEDLFRNNGGSSAPNIKELTKKKITL